MSEHRHSGGSLNLGHTYPQETCGLCVALEPRGSRVVQTRRAQSSGTIVSIIDNRDGSYDDGGPAWFTECEDHGCNCGHETLALAREWAPVPREWCPHCQPYDPSNPDPTHPGA